MRVVKGSIFTLLCFMPVIALAHEGHHHTSGFWSGFIHPFTGLDHLVMALGLGALLWSAQRQWQMVGALALAVSMGAGFMLGTQQLLPASIAEYGIVASLLVVALGMYNQSFKSVLPVAALLLGACHGMAHGTELTGYGHPAELMAGMMIAMSLIYGIGVLLGTVLLKRFPHTKKIFAVVATIVAVFGLA